MIMMGGGTGFAPLKSMIEHLLEEGDRREIHLFWGAQTREELYLDEMAAGWAEKHDHIHYRRAISNQAPSSDEAFNGFVHEAVVAAFPDLAGFDVYMSGPPAMIDAARITFAECNLDNQRLFYDSFEFGLDVPVRVLARPH